MERTRTRPSNSSAGRSLVWLAASLLLFLPLISSATVARQSEPLRNGSDPLLFVTTTSGRVQGKEKDNIYQYLGIPYGRSTAGTRRFRAPVAAPFSSKLIDATEFGSSCPQLVNNGSLAVSKFTDSKPPDLQHQSEDCLSINVFVRNDTRVKGTAFGSGKGGAAVLIWIFGGSFQYGTSSSFLYDAQNFVKDQDDLIVVSFNYRTNIFGFPLSPQIRAADASTGWNRGLQDRDLALKWVYNNIARFGGDPNRITLFGESAGGTSVDSWAFANANTQNPMVKGIIIQSGAVQGLDLSLTEFSTNWARSASPWNRVANHKLVGCGLTSDAAQLACMQKVPFPALLDAIVDTNLLFGPSPDNKLYFDDWVGRSQRGQFAKVPTLIGTNEDEGTILTGLFLTDISAMVSQAAIITPLIFTCPARQEALDRTRYGVPTWRYVYHGNWDNINSGITALGAYHFSEVPILFRTYSSSYLSNPAHSVVISEQQTAVTGWMQGAWAAFARNPQSGLTAYGWPRYNVWNKTLAHIARNNSGATTFGIPDPLDLGCTVAVTLESSVYQLVRRIASLL